MTPRPLLGQPHHQEHGEDSSSGAHGQSSLGQLLAREAANNWHLPGRGGSGPIIPPGPAESSEHVPRIPGC